MFCIRRFCFERAMKFLTAISCAVPFGMSLLPCANAGDYASLPESFKQKWEALLHYSRGKSDIDNDGQFFLAPNGHVSPASELLATLSALQASSDVRCRFPARTYLITGQLPSDSCEGFNEYKKYISAQKVALVFASESSTSPVSSMGHLFLVVEGVNALGLNKRHAVAFVADSSANGNLLIEFLKDSIVGRYVLNPYDDSIYTYVSKEKRSLWEYELILTPEQKNWLFLHLYELKANATKYSFFSHNCSTGINRILSTANEAFHYKDDRYYVTPIEYTKYVNAAELVRSITVRPSDDDLRRLRQGLPLDPLKSPKTSKLSVSTVYDRDLRYGVRLKLLPFHSDIEEDVVDKTSLTEVKFGEVTASAYKDHFIVENLTLVNLRSLTNLQYEGLKPGFGIQLHGNVDQTHTSLYPDVHVGTGFVWGETGLRPFCQFDVGAHLMPNDSKLYFNNRIGAIFTSSVLGKVTFWGSRPLASSGHYRNIAKQWHLNFSKKLGERFELTASADLYETADSRNRKQITFGLGYRF